MSVATVERRDKTGVEASAALRSDVSILVVSYNTREMTLACLRSVYEQTRDTPFELIVIDNDSADGSADAIEREFPRARLIRSSENLGFARANNVAAREARGEYLLLLNPDTVVLERAIDRLVRFAHARPEAKIWGGRTLDGKGRLDPSSVWAEMTAWSAVCRGLGLSALCSGWSLFNGEAMPGWDRDSEREVDVVTGCLLLIRRDLWERLGGFDEGFFMYGEETDLCLRARGEGARPRMTPEATIVHYGGASEAVRWAKMVRLFCAKARLMGKHWGSFGRTVGVWSLGWWALTRLVATSVVGLTSSSARERAAQWREVWKRRREWRAAARAGASSRGGGASTVTA